MHYNLLVSIAVHHFVVQRNPLLAEESDVGCRVVLDVNVDVILLGAVLEPTTVDPVVVKRQAHFAGPTLVGVAATDNWPDRQLKF